MLVLLSILDELILLIEVFDRFLLSGHLVFEDFDFGLELDVLFLVHIGQLLHLDRLFLESFGAERPSRSVDEIASALSTRGRRVCLLDHPLRLHVLRRNCVHGVSCWLIRMCEPSCSFLRRLRRSALLLLIVVAHLVAALAEVECCDCRVLSTNFGPLLVAVRMATACVGSLLLRLSVVEDQGSSLW